MKSFFARWAATTFAVFVASGLVPGITYDTAEALVCAGLLLGILNAVVRPVLMVLSLPLIVLSFGMVIPIINAILLEWVSGWIKGFHVDGFGSALFGAVVISLVSWGLNNFFQDRSRTEVRVETFPTAGESEPEYRVGMKTVQGRVIEHENEPK